MSDSGVYLHLSVKEAEKLRDLLKYEQAHELYQEVFHKLSRILGYER